MAITYSTRGTGTHGTASTSLVVSPTSDIPDGHYAVLCVAYDNAGTNGADPLTSIVDSKGNAWLNFISGLNDPGAASAGIVGRISEALVTNGPLTTSDTITLNFSVNVTAKAWVLYSAAAPDGMVPEHQNQAAASQTSATPSITTASITNGQSVVACVMREANGTRTADGDSTNGTWSNPQHTGVGTGAAGAEVICETKVVTASATQTYNPTFGGASADGVNIWIQLAEAVRTVPRRRDPYPQLLPL